MLVDQKLRNRSALYGLEVGKGFCKDELNKAERRKAIGEAEVRVGEREGCILRMGSDAPMLHPAPLSPCPVPGESSSLQPPKHSMGHILLWSQGIEEEAEV